MSGETTLGSIGTNIRGYFSGITRESVGQFCTEKKDYVVSCARNIPGYMQESHSNAATILIGANALCLAILNFAILSPIERRMESNTTDQERLLSKKKFLNLLGVGAAFYALNIGLTKLHKYELSKTQLLLITAVVVSYRLFRLTMPQVVPPTPTAEELEIQARGAAATTALDLARAAGLAQQAAEAAEEARDNAGAPLAAALQARAQLPALQVASTQAFDNDLMRAVVNTQRAMEQLQQQVTAAAAELAEIADATAARHVQLTALLDGVAEDLPNNVPAVVGLRDQHQAAVDANTAAREAAGQEQGGDVPEGSLLGIAAAAQGARNIARQVVDNNQEALAAYDELAATARVARDAADIAEQAAGVARDAADALLPPVPAAL